MERQKIAPWKPTRGWLNSGRFNYGTYYTVSKPHFHLKTASGEVIGVIQWLSGDDAVIQVGEEKPETLTTSLLYALTNYGKGYVGRDFSQPLSPSLASAMHYIFGPYSDYPDAIATVELIRSIH